jgi:hypothetical protein
MSIGVGLLISDVASGLWRPLRPNTFLTIILKTQKGKYQWSANKDGQTLGEVTFGRRRGLRRSSKRRPGLFFDREFDVET